MSPDIVPIVRPSSAARIITDSVNTAHALQIEVTTSAELGVVCNSTRAPRWERDPLAASVSVLGAVLLAKQPPIPDADAALTHVFGSRLAFHLGIEDGCSGADTKAGVLHASDRQLYIDGYLLGVQLRTLISTVPCEFHKRRYPRGERCPLCAAAVPVERPADEPTNPMQLDTPRSLIAELLNALTPSQGLEALADSCRDRAPKLPPDLAEDLRVVEFTLREMAAEVRGVS